jgi:hypothetical protein
MRLVLTDVSVWQSGQNGIPPRLSYHRPRRTLPQRRASRRRDHTAAKGLPSGCGCAYPFLSRIVRLSFGI